MMPSANPAVTSDEATLPSLAHRRSILFSSRSPPTHRPQRLPAPCSDSPPAPSLAALPAPFPGSGSCHRSESHRLPLYLVSGTLQSPVRSSRGDGKRGRRHMHPRILMQYDNVTIGKPCRIACLPFWPFHRNESTEASCAHLRFPLHILFPPSLLHALHPASRPPPSFCFPALYERMGGLGACLLCPPCHAAAHMQSANSAATQSNICRPRQIA